jgi:hypothetical protein
MTGDSRCQRCPITAGMMLRRAQGSRVDLAERGTGWSMFKWILRTILIGAAAWAWRKYRERRAEERALGG